VTNNSSQKAEVINRNSFVNLALGQGFNVFLPVYDGGIDFIIDRENGNELYKVQLKSRWTIDKKYEGRDIWIAFPVGKEWYLIPHDEMIRVASPGVVSSRPWVEKDRYSKRGLSKADLARYNDFRFPKSGPASSVP
jgi:hypothetical protein